MNNQTFVIPTHSFSSLITNSSSETFIASSEKSIDAVKEILRALMDEYNEAVDKYSGLKHEDRPKEYKFHDYKSSFEKAFGNIYLSPYEFDFSKCSDALAQRGDCDYLHTKVHLKELGEEAIEAFREKCNKIYSLERNQFPSRRKHKNKWRQRNIACSEGRKNLAKKHFAAHFNKWFNSDVEIIKKAFVVNGFSPDEAIKNIKMECCWWDMGDFSTDIHYKRKFYNDNLEFMMAFGFAWHNGTAIKKGDIIIKSKDDNSIPYGLFKSIEKTLNAKRFHGD